MPTSRATLVTSSAKADSWSTIVLTVCFSSCSSPAASTVTLRVRSPLATAVVTTAMSRTCAVRRPAMVLTALVTSRHRPDIPRSGAWPPSRPSVPTSLATWVTWEVKVSSWSTMVLTERAILSMSPRSARPSARSSTLWDRSPEATASTTCAMATVGPVSASIRPLDASMVAAQEPAPGPAFIRSSSRPSRETSLRTRMASWWWWEARSRIWSTRSSAVAMAPWPLSEFGLKSPSRSLDSAWSSGSISASL